MVDAPDAAPDLLPVRPDARGFRTITPTDVSQFIRLDQCRRYLRLRLHQHSPGRAGNFMADYDVNPQSIPPLLTRSGAYFEQLTEAAVPAELRLNLQDERRAIRGRPHDNERVIHVAHGLGPGETKVLFQPRVLAELGSWRLRGDIDILRLERDGEGRLHVLIADMKSSTSAKVEHRLQVAFYHEMLAAILAEAGIAHEPIELGVLYRGPAEDDAGLDPDTLALHAVQREEARRRLWAENGLLEIVANPGDYIGTVREQVTGERSVASEVADAEFEALPWHLTYKCDGCIYNEFCMKWAAEHDDLSLLPHISATDKTALHTLGIDTTSALVALRVPSAHDARVLQPAPGAEELNRRVAATWPIGPKVDGLVQRARAYRRYKGEEHTTSSYLPNTGHGSLPYCDAQHNPNLVRVYIDAQHDYLHDRVYLLGALVVGSAGGEDDPQRRRSIVRMTNGPPAAPLDEERLFLDWIGATLTALREVAAPDDAGELRAPIHLIFFDSYAQRVVLEGLSRHFSRVLGATPLYDFMTQIAAFDSPVISLLEREIRERRNFPMVCQSLQAVAAYLKFDWRAPEDYRKHFRARMFDFWGALGEDESGNRVDWYTSRSRFSSQVPLEYAYAAWGDLDRPSETGARRDYSRYRAATVDLLRGFAARRLEAIEHITRSFHGNDKTTKTSFDLSVLDAFESRAGTLAEALCEFVAIERHVALAAWKNARLLSPERRVLTGETLLVRYLEADQDPGVAEENRDHQHRQALWEEYAAAFRSANPDATRVQLPKAQRDETKWNAEGMEFRLRIAVDDVGLTVEEALSLNGISAGDWVVLYPRWTVDGRLPPAEQVRFQPTPKQMLYGMRAEVLGFEAADAPGANGAGETCVRVRIVGSFGGGQGGFLFAGRSHPLEAGESYSLDPNPNDIYGFWQMKVVEGLRDGGRNELYRRLNEAGIAGVDWPDAAAAGQRRFLDGLAALREMGLHDFGPAQRDYIGGRGDDPVLLVQGPPGTGKSYTTAFAVFARLQGALAADIDYRVFASCKTHAATDVLLSAVAAVRARLAGWHAEAPELFARYFDARLLDIPLFRLQPREAVAADVRRLHADDFKTAGRGKMADAILDERWCFAATAPGGTYRLISTSFSRMFGNEFVDCLILDEASQMNLPEAIMAALPLKPAGRLIIVGDHRQMPPIVHHDWDSEPRRTFQQYKTYQSLFESFRRQGLRMVQFDESFRLHRDMAEFLRQEIYAEDGIDFHARHCNQLLPIAHDDPLVAAVLYPAMPLVVVIHEEARSQVRNGFEQALIEPVLRALAQTCDDPEMLVREHLGVVVPHRAQRAAVQAGVPQVCLRDPDTGVIRLSSVDTVERFQGGERDAILVSATESDPEYLLVSNKFLLDPRRLTVAISRARKKMILVASRSVFNVFSADEETFEHAQIWKNLLRTTCTEQLWSGMREWRGRSIPVEVWGKRAAD